MVRRIFRMLLRHSVPHTLLAQLTRPEPILNPFAQWEAIAARSRAEATSLLRTGASNSHSCMAVLKFQLQLHSTREAFVQSEVHS